MSKLDLIKNDLTLLKLILNDIFSIEPLRMITQKQKIVIKTTSHLLYNNNQ